MKNLFRSRILLTTLIIFGIVLIVSRTSFAQEAVSTGLETQISQLVDTLEKLLVAEKGDTAVTAQTEGVTVMANSTSSETIKSSCMDDYATWQHSNTFRDNAPWNLDFIARRERKNNMIDNTTEQFVDLNGDGLSDYLYDYRYLYSGSGTKMTHDETCVYLSNGNGYDLAYKCSADIVYMENYLPYDRKDFYGDCAQM
jgi:hypothetical protein